MRDATAWAASFVLLATACASPSPEPSIQFASEAVERAEEAQARRYAPADLARARDRLSEAQAGAANSSDWIEARRAAEKAAVDAQVAAARAGAERLRISVQEVRRSVREAGVGEP